MNNHSGTVGIVMPMYNARETVLRAVQSVINQTYQDWHLYLINDKSTDDSLAWVREQCQDPRITILDNAVNMGAAETRNVGLRASQEEVIAFLDSDDEWHSDKLRQQMQAIADGDNLVITEYHYKTAKLTTIFAIQSLTLSRTAMSKSSIGCASHPSVSAVRQAGFYLSEKVTKTSFSSTNSLIATNRPA